MIKYPMEFKSVTHSPAGMHKPWSTHTQNFRSDVSVPPEFLGPGGALSPEDLYNHALTNCFVATFKVYAENSKLTFESIDVESNLVVDLDENKKPVMKEFHAKVFIKKPSQGEKALMLAKKAAQSGFILNSVKTKCQFEFEILA